MTQTVDAPTHPIPPVTSKRPNPGMMAGSFAASRAPLLTVDEVLNLRAVSAVAYADIRSVEASAFEPVTTFTAEEEAILAEAGWTEVPMIVTRFDTLRVDFGALRDRVRQAWLHALYVLTANRFPTHEYLHLENIDLSVLADLWNMLEKSSRPLTERQYAWVTAG